MLSCPLGGIAADEVLDAGPALLATEVEQQLVELLTRVLDPAARRLDAISAALHHWPESAATMESV